MSHEGFSLWKAKVVPDIIFSSHLILTHIVLCCAYPSHHDTGYPTVLQGIQKSNNIRIMLMIQEFYMGH